MTGTRPKRRRESRVSRQKARATLAASKALELRAEGLSYDAIAKELGASKGTAYKRVRAEMAAVAEGNRRNAEALFRAELAELDEAIELARADARARKGAWRISLKIWGDLLRDRRKLLGVEGQAEATRAAEQTEVDFEHLRELLRAEGYDLVPLPEVVETTGEPIGS